ncbi:hypothetical protein ACTFIZ_012501 [Dictyostelium cf. discoideum]
MSEGSTPITNSPIIIQTKSEPTSPTLSAKSESSSDSASLPVSYDSGAFAPPLTFGHQNNDLRRVRKNAAHLSEEERNNFLLAVVGLKNKYPNNCKYSVYDQFVILHMGAVSLARKSEYDEKDLDVFNNNKLKVDPGHSNPAFLSWHRMLLNKFEKALQTIDPSVTLPYWDWTDRDASTNNIFIKEFMGGNGGIDGLGGKLVNSVFTSENGFYVREELHKASKADESLGNTVVRYLGPFDFLATPQSEFKEFLSSNTFSPSAVIMDPDTKRVKPADENNRGFRIGVEAGLKAHNPTHDWYGYGSGAQMPQQLQIDQGKVQGDDPANVVWKTQEIYSSISTMTNVACSNNDPIFWLHHCNIDRLWADWQDQGHFGDMYFPKKGRDSFQVVNDKTAEPYTYPWGHNLDDPLWPWDNSLSFTVPWLQESLPISYSYYESKDVIDFRSLGYQYDTSSTIAFNAKPVKAFPNGPSKQVFKFTINSIKAQNYYFVLNSNGNAKINDISIHTKYNENDINEWDFQTKGFTGSELNKPPVKHIKGDTIDKVSFEAKRGTYYVVVSSNGIADINSYYTIAIKDSDPQLLQTGYQGIISFGLKETDPTIQVKDVVAKIKGTKEFFFVYVKELCDLSFKVKGIDALIQLIGPSTSTDIIGLDEGCCKHSCPSVSATLTPGHYLIQLFHCSFNDQIGKTGKLEIKYSTENVEKKVKTIKSGSSITEKIPESGTVLFKIQTESNTVDTLYVSRVGLHSFSSCTEVNQSIYETLTKTTDPYGYDCVSSVIASGKFESICDLQNSIDNIKTYYIRVSFPQAPHINSNDKFTLKFKAF